MSQHISDRYCPFFQTVPRQFFQDVCRDLVRRSFPVFQLAQYPLQFFLLMSKFHQSPLSGSSTNPPSESSAWARSTWSAGIEMWLWKKLVRSVVEFSCFAIELQLQFLLCVFLGAFSVSALSLILVRCFSRFRALRFRQIAQQSLSVSGRPRRCPSLFFLQQKSLELQFRHSHLYRLHQVVRLCSFQEQGRHHSPIFPVKQRLGGRSLS